MYPKYFFLIFYILVVSCSLKEKNSDNPKSQTNRSERSKDSNATIQLTPNPIIISDSSRTYSDTSSLELSLKTKDILLKKIGEVSWPGRHFLSGVKARTKTAVCGRKMEKLEEPLYTEAKPIVKQAGYPIFKKLNPLKHSETALYDIQHIDQRALDITWSKDGSAWIATGLEIAHLQGDFMESYGVAQGALSAVSNISIDNLGNVWSAFNGAGYFDGKSFYLFREKQGFTDADVYIMFKDSKGRMWFGTRGAGVFCYTGKGFLQYGKKQGLCMTRVVAIMEDNNGNMWFGTEGKGVLKFNGETFINYSMEEGLPTTYVYSIYQTKDGKIWFGHYPGALSVLSHDTLTAYDFGHAMNSGIFSLTETNENKLLIATIGSGLLRFDGNKFEKIDKEVGLKETMVMKLAHDPDQNIWALGAFLNRLRMEKFNYVPVPGTQGVYQIDKDKRLILNLDKYTYIDKEKVVTYNSTIGFKTSGMVKDAMGRMWYDSWCEGIGIVEGDKLKSVLIDGKTNWGCFASIGKGVNGEIWFPSWTYGLMRLKKDKLITYNKNRTFDDLGALNTSFCDKKGIMWFGGSSNELVKYDGIYFHRFPVLESTLKKLGGIGINAISDSADGTLLISCMGAGIVSYDGNKFSLHNDAEFKIGVGADITETGLQEFLKTDHNGRIWVILNGKLTCVQNGKRMQFGPSDGFLFTPVSYSFDEDGTMWFSNEEMTGSVKVEHLLETEKPPVVTITKLNIFQHEIDYRSLQDSILKRRKWVLPDVNVNLGKLRFDPVEKFKLLPQNIVFPYKANQLSLVYGSTDLNIQGNVLFSYLLTGYDKTWSLPTEERIANYKNLSPGDYTFKVKARSINGDFGEITTYSFKVTPPWWKTWWARIGYGLIALLLIWAYNRWRIASFKQRQKELESEVEVATTEIRKQKDVAEIQRAKAEKSEQFKQQFLANMSHEIRTPMNAVMGMTNLVLETPLKEKQKFYLERIKKSSDNLLHIINDILDLSKIEAGKMELEYIDFSLTDLVDQVKQTLNHKADEKGLELLTRIPRDLPDVVIGDPARLNQVLINIAGNAIKFTEKGSISIEVTKEQDGIQFAIIDTGIGIPKDKLQTVFESFTQANTSDTRKYGGTGLGLSISRQLVGMMGSTITIESEEGSGTTFSFIINFESGSADRLEQRTAIEKSVDGSILDGLKILVTDDNEYNRIVARDTLKSNADLEIYEASNGHEAIELVGKMQFDVILMDVQMPGMNGFDATRYIRTNLTSPSSDTPIIALTASVLRTDLDKCKAAGMNSYIPKPFSAQQLITGIAQVLNITLKAKKKGNPKTEEIHASGVTDLAYLHKFCEGDNVRMNKYINMFTSTAPGLISKINIAYENKDFDEIANQVHGFKTKWIMMGMTQTKDLAIKLEQLCREGGEVKSIAETMAHLITNIELAAKELGN